MKTFKKIYKSIPTFAGKTYLVTGANSGLGYTITKLLIKKDAAVIMVNRDKKRTENAITRLKRRYPKANISAYFFDQGDKSSIVELVRSLKRNNVSFEGIILNAGIYTPHKDVVTKDQIAATFGVNFVGNYNLVKELANSNFLRNDKRIVFTSSLAAKNTFSSDFFDALLTGKKLGRHKQYQGSKTALNIFALALMAKDENLPFQVDAKTFVFHPGITSSNIARFKIPTVTVVVNFLMKLVFHRRQKAVLGALIALGTTDDLNGKMYVPRSFKEWRGLPKVKKIDESLNAHRALLIKKTEAL